MLMQIVGGIVGGKFNKLLKEKSAEKFSGFFLTEF